MQLRWRIFDNPIFSNNLWLDVDAARFDISQAQFETSYTTGFGTATLELRNVPRALIYDALQRWYWKRVTATDAAGFTAYEGVIAEMHAQIDNAEYEWKTDEYATRVQVRYTESDPLHPGSTRTSSVTVSNDAAESMFGIRTELYDITGHGTITRTQATAYANTMLARVLTPIAPTFNAYDEHNPQANVLTLTLWGFFTTLSFQLENYNPTKKDIAAIITDIMGRTKVQMLNTTDLTHIATTGTQIIYSPGDLKAVDEYFNDLIQYGDSANKMLILQVWENRTLYLKARGTTTEYFARAGDNRIYNSARAVIPPWRVRAGNFMSVENFPSLTSAYSDVDNDPRAFLIADTKYDDVTGKFSYNPLTEQPVEMFLGRLRNGVRTVKV